jgi:hypothetical protein
VNAFLYRVWVMLDSASRWLIRRPRNRPGW